MTNTMTFSQSNTISAIITNNLVIGIRKILAMGGDPVIVTIPHTATNLYAPFAQVNRQPI